MFPFSDTCGHLCIEWMKPCDALIPLFCKWGHRSLLHCNIKRHPRCCVFELLNFPLRAFSAHAEKKKLPPEAHTCLTVTQLANPSSRKRNILKSFFNHFPHTKKTQRRISASSLSIFRWAALRMHAEPLSLLTYCVQISRQLSARTKKKKNLMKSSLWLFRHDPHLICGMSLQDVEHPELIS